MFDFIAMCDGSYGTVWGPCTDGQKIDCDCPQCSHANQLVRSGLDWDEEYRKAEAKGFKQ